MHFNHITQNSTSHSLAKNLTRYPYTEFEYVGFVGLMQRYVCWLILIIQFFCHQV